MINVKTKRCEYDGCDLQPYFNIKGKQGRFCSSHKLDSMIDVYHKRCEYVNCDSLNPTFDIKGGKGRFYSSHKLANMIDVKHKTCEYNDCIKRANFDFKGNKGCFCSSHKTDGMIDIVTKYCEYNNCNVIKPVFDIKGGKGRFCVSHKTSEMINVISKRCEYDGCNLLNPVFDVKGGKGRFCSSHKTIEMIDVKTKRCEYNGCNKSVYYGKPGMYKSHCAQHKQPGMIRNPTKRCSKCKNKAIWGNNNNPIHCELHKTENDINLVEQPCSSCNLLNILDKTNRCEYCNPNVCESTRLTKQNALMNYLDNINLYGSSTDTIIDGGICGKERPDRIYDFGDKIVILECDENQHRSRPCECEQTRMINIGQSFGGIPVYFIRWNPDNYKPVNNKKIQETLTKRHKLCGDLIDDIKQNKISLPYALVSAIYLYYDGWSSIQDEKWKTFILFEDA